MKCTICKKPIVLVPSAEQRAKKFGGTPAYYTALYTEHAVCTLKRRTDDTLALMRRLAAEVEANRVVLGRR